MAGNYPIGTGFGGYPAGTGLGGYPAGTGIGGYPPNPGVSPGPPGQNIALLLHGIDPLSPPNSLVVSDSSIYSAVPTSWSVLGSATNVTANPGANSSNNNPRSIYFPVNTSGYLLTDYEPRFAMGLEDYTIECWLWRVGDGCVFDSRPTGQPTQNGGVMEFGGAPNHSLTYVEWENGSYKTLMVPTTPFPGAQWVHVAISREGDTTRLFQDGLKIAESTATPLSKTNLSTQHIQIGLVCDSVRPLDGYINEFRVTKGIAVYVSDFSPPVCPFPTPVAPPAPPPRDVSVLLYGDGTIGNTTLFPDYSFWDATFTATGVISTQANPNTPPASPTDYNQFSSTSIYTPMTGCLKAPNNSAYDLTSGAFTIEAFLYPLSYGNGYPAPGSFGTGAWLDTRTFGGNYQGIFLNFESTSHAPQLALAANLSFYKYAGSNAMPLNQWSHVAFVRYPNNSGAIYMNGVQEASFSFPAITNFLNQSITVGQDTDANNSFAFDGYINQVRLTKGVALYSGASYSVPSAAFPKASP